MALDEIPDDGGIYNEFLYPSPPAAPATGGTPATTTAAAPTGGGMGMPNAPGGGFGYRFSDVPDFTPPGYKPPTLESAQQEPGYQFRLESGNKALNASAAARGVLRTGGTLKDIVNYGQNFAQQEYANVYDRSLRQYDQQYRGAKDAYMPQFQSWLFQSGAEKERAQQEFQAQQNIYGLNMQAYQAEQNRIAALQQQQWGASQ